MLIDDDVIITLSSPPMPYARYAAAALIEMPPLRRALREDAVSSPCSSRADFSDTNHSQP